MIDLEVHLGESGDASGNPAMRWPITFPPSSTAIPSTRKGDACWP